MTAQTASELLTTAVFTAMATVVDQAAALDDMLAELAPEWKCELCGLTDVESPEDIAGREEGRYYSGCCNEPIVSVD